MDIYQTIINKIIEQELDVSLNVSKIKLVYINDTLNVVPNDYISTESERVFWYNKVNGQNFLTEI